MTTPPAMTDQDKTLGHYEREYEAEALRVNAGREPKFGDLMRNPWASETNPRREAYFVRKHGKLYEFTDKKGEFWETTAKFAVFVDAALPQQVVAGSVDTGQLDLVVEANRALLHERSQVGIRKYGATLADNNHPRSALLTHALEEALDLANYLQAELQRDARQPAQVSGDAALMGWMEAQNHIHALQWRCGQEERPVRTSLYDRNRRIIAEGPTLRDAVRAAMSSQPADGGAA